MADSNGNTTASPPPPPPIRLLKETPTILAEMRATAVCQRFLASAEPREDSAWKQWLKGELPFPVPNLWCSECGRLLHVLVDKLRKGGPVATQCPVGTGCRPSAAA